MKSHMRLRGPVTCSGIAKSIGPAAMFSRSSSPELQLLSSSWEDLYGDFGGDSRIFGRSGKFVGGALKLVYGAGGGGALLVLFSALVSAFLFLALGVSLGVGLLLSHAFPPLSCIPLFLFWGL